MNFNKIKNIKKFNFLDFKWQNYAKDEYMKGLYEFLMFWLLFNLGYLGLKEVRIINNWIGYKIMSFIIYIVCFGFSIKFVLSELEEIKE